ncbi:MAG TPA: hypothetical protein VFS26_04780, partial [Solirubrobacterales bacterium]|nr:hypothetical protein [Solirubrobacterales bacterium]
REDPSLLLGHGSSLDEFADRRRTALAAENDAWEAYEQADADQKKNLKGAVLRAEAERERIDEAMSWLFSYARFVEVSRSFRVALRSMFAAAAIAALGIAGFAWAAHPEDGTDQEASVVAKAPLAVELDLSGVGRETLADDLGDGCKLEALPAVAIAGTVDALEVVTVPSKSCALDRFVLTPELGTYQAVEVVAGDEEPIHRKGNPSPPVTGG